MKKTNRHSFNLKNMEEVENHCRCDFFDVTEHSLDFSKESIQEIIEHYDLKSFHQNTVYKKMIQYGNVIPMIIEEEEKHFVIEHFDFSETIGKIFLCDHASFIK
jgi:hypothetical protein